MIYQGNKPIDTMYVGSKLVQQVYKGSRKVYPEHGVIPKAIKDSMVLWYDIKRQGATNENMASNPTLRDLSGNGHDATCYNFAWSVMSGIGGYNINFTQWGYSPGNINRDMYVFNIIHASNNTALLHYTDPLPEFRFKVTGITGTNTRLEFGSGTIPESDKSIKEDGEYFVEASGSGAKGFKLYGDSSVTVNITVELLPAYPNALVSDGVDDYCLVEGLPLLNKEDGYTVIAKRKRLSNMGCLASKRNTTSTDGAFVFELSVNGEDKRCDSFNGRNQISSFADTISWQTKNSYNGEPISVGDIEDNDVLRLFLLYDHYYCQVALHSFLLFNRDLTSEEIAWVKTNLIEGNDNDADWYGVEFYTTSDNPDCVRIGNPELHKTFPVHSQMKGCLLADDGTVNKYLNESDWTSETLDGSQGQVMVEMPKQSYWKFETDGNIRRVKFSTKPLDGFKPTPQGYVSAYEAALQRSTNKLASVVNTTADYRGGNNNSGWDNTYRSLLGMPATQISRTNFRNYARNRKADSTEWNCMTYDMQKLLYWLFVTEYGTLNSQKAFNSDKDANGYAQGGLGNGVTNLNGTKWSDFNSYYPFIPCGYTNSLGNGTGEVEFSMPKEYDSAGLTVKVPRYRGIENPFGHLWKWTDGINVRISPTEENGGDNLSKVYICSYPTQFKDNGYGGYTYVGDEARTEQYAKEVIFGEGGEIMPKVVGDGASSTKYFCDYHYTSIPTTETLRGVVFGGRAYHGSYAGFAYADSSFSPSSAGSHLGSRLCFIPNNN